MRTTTHEAANQGTTKITKFTKVERTKKRPLCALWTLWFVWFSVFVVAAAPPSKTRAFVEALASPHLEGRLAGSNGEKLASDYLAAVLDAIGAKPLPGQRGPLQPFQFTAGT